MHGVTCPAAARQAVLPPSPPRVQAGTLCTGALIAPDVVLTAANCWRAPCRGAQGLCAGECPSLSSPRAGTMPAWARPGRAPTLPLATTLVQLTLWHRASPRSRCSRALVQPRESYSAQHLAVAGCTCMLQAVPKSGCRAAPAACTAQQQAVAGCMCDRVLHVLQAVKLPSAFTSVSRPHPSCQCAVQCRKGRHGRAWLCMPWHCLPHSHRPPPGAPPKQPSAAQCPPHAQCVGISDFALAFLNTSFQPTMAYGYNSSLPASLTLHTAGMEASLFFSAACTLCVPLLLTAMCCRVPKCVEPAWLLPAAAAAPALAFVTDVDCAGGRRQVHSTPKRVLRHVVCLAPMHQQSRARIRSMLAQGIFRPPAAGTQRVPPSTHPPVLRGRTIACQVVPAALHSCLGTGVVLPVACHPPILHP